MTRRVSDKTRERAWRDWAELSAQLVILSTANVPRFLCEHRRTVEFKVGEIKVIIPKKSLKEVSHDHRVE